MLLDSQCTEKESLISFPPRISLRNHCYHNNKHQNRSCLKGYINTLSEHKNHENFIQYFPWIKACLMFQICGTVNSCNHEEVN